MFSKELLRFYPLDTLNRGASIDPSKLHGFSAEVLKEYVEMGKDGYEFSGYCASLLRTGLLIPVPALGGVSYLLSPLFIMLVRTIQSNIDSVLS